MVTVANTKMMVRPASRMLSAISFGVFARSAPSTSLIMRSMKVEPCAAVIRTRIQSDRTWVPPVTAERSPPDSRITGADSPVMAASLTDATPSITSPSEGMVSPASTSTMSPTLRLVPGTNLKGRSEPVSSLAWLSVRVLRSDSACALPRPSATASAKLANSTVNQSQTMIWKVKPRFSPAVRRSRRKITVVSAATISTTNITGFLIIKRGSSLMKDARIAGTTILGSSIAETDARFCRFVVSMEVTPNNQKAVDQNTSRSEHLAGVHREMLDDGAEGEGREEGEAADDQDHADDEADEQPARGREGARGRRDRFLGGQRTRDRHRRDDHEEAADEHRACEREIVEEGVAGEAREGRAVVAGRRGEGIEHLGEAMRPGIRHRGDRRRIDHADRGPSQIHQRQHQDREHRHLHFARLDLLADILRRAADHQACHEDRKHDEQQHAIEAGADAADDDFAELHIDQGNHAAERREAVMHGVDRAAGGGRRDHGEQGGRDDAEANLLAFHVAAGQAERVQGRSTVGLRPIGDGDTGDEQHAHHGQDRPALALAADHAAEHVGQRRTQHEDR